MGAFHNPTLVSNYQALYADVFAQSILWMVYYQGANLEKKNSFAKKSERSEENILLQAKTFFWFFEAF